MEGKKDFRQRIHSGAVTRQDVRRLLAELACGKVNDCVRLALEEQPCLEKLDLRLLGAVKRNDNGTVEIKLIDRVKVLERLEQAMDDGGDGIGELLRALGGEEEP